MPSRTTELSVFKAGPGTSLYFETGGRSDASKEVLFLHGFGASTLNWADVRAAFEERCRVTLLDLKGHGRSSRPRDGNYSLDEQADLLLQFLAWRRQPDPIIVAHSYGGAVALLALVKEVQRNRRPPATALVIVDAPAYPQPVPIFLSALYTPILSTIVSILPTRFSVNYTLTRAFYDGRKVTPQIIDRYVQVMEVPDSQYALGLAAKQMMPKDLDAYLAGIQKIRIPTLILWGANDNIVPLSTANRLHKEISASTLKTINSCGHVPQEECPEEFVSAVRGFLNDLGVKTGEITGGTDSRTASNQDSSKASQSAKK